MTSLSFHSAVANHSPRRVHWRENLRILSRIREKKIGKGMRQLTSLSRRNRSATATRHPIEEKNHPPSSSAPQHEADDVFQNWNSLRIQLIKTPKIERNRECRGNVRRSVVHPDILHVHRDIVFIWQHISHTFHSSVLSEYTLRHLVERRLWFLSDHEAMIRNNVIGDDNPRCHAPYAPARSHFRHAQKRPRWSPAPEPRLWCLPTGESPRFRFCRRFPPQN